jgi:hypothetical protein
MEANTQGLSKLNSELERLSKERGDVLVKRTVRSDPRIVTESLRTGAGRSYYQAARAGGALLGR